jgi:hypothetical protein
VRLFMPARLRAHVGVRTSESELSLPWISSMASTFGPEAVAGGSVWLHRLVRVYLLARNYKVAAAIAQNGPPAKQSGSSGQGRRRNGSCYWRGVRAGQNHGVVFSGASRANLERVESGVKNV